MRLQWNERLAVTDLRPGALGDAKHDALARPVDVGIQHTDPRPLTGQRQRQISRRGGLADAALAGRHRDDVLHIGQRPHLILRLVRTNHAVHLHIGTVDALAPFNGHRQHLRPTAAKQPGGVAQLQLHADPVALDVD